jgi:hypothetical protein
VSGSAQQFNGVAIDGNRSVGIKYSFAGGLTTTQSVFADFAQAIALPADTRDLSFWYKGDGNGCLLKAVIVDANDKSYGMTIDSNVTSTEWKQATVSVPSDAVFPITLKKLCVEALNTTDPVEGTIYVDNIGAVIGGRATATQAGLSDPQRGNLSSATGEEISLFGQTKSGTKGSAFESIFAKMKENARLTVFVGESNVSGADVVWQNKYETYETNDFSVVTLGDGSGSLASNSSEQLRHFRTYLNSMSKDNIIVCMEQNLMSSTGIKDSREREAIFDILKTASLEYDKNIIVVSASGSESGVTIKDGVRYVTLGGLNESNLTYLRVKADSTGFRYELVN